MVLDYADTVIQKYFKCQAQSLKKLNENMFLYITNYFKKGF